MYRNLQGFSGKRSDTKESAYPSLLKLALGLHNLITSASTLSKFPMIRNVHLLKRPHPIISHPLRNLRWIRLPHLHVHIHEHASDGRRHALQVGLLAPITVKIDLVEILDCGVDKTFKFLFHELLEQCVHTRSIFGVVLAVVARIGGRDRELRGV